MTDWEDAINLMRENGRKRKIRKADKVRVGLRCWECGLYIDNFSTGHYCSRCLLIKLKKLTKGSSGNYEEYDKHSSKSDHDAEDDSDEANEDSKDEDYR